ncbi:response regulator [Brevundimonas sp. SORGH_AS_0993]|uniref:ATP-binding response regulator n=1 Tax=Brevundimonas sp. SORGH_AS_0993 TaxID=3041794 RepID=UPI0027849775|nr:response regulator [Brevundimonas sp. SORGH_AS_0993]MDQ1155280.1 CheY-like chemotaxis protein/signal transduction histidine kinase [Brevundimonas sp. SORGH_AS_0993]
MEFVLLGFILLVAAAVAGAGWRQAFRARQEAVALRRLNLDLQRRLAAWESDTDAARRVEEHHVQSALLRAVGRELRTPLTTVMGFAQWLGSAPDADPLTHRQAQALRRIEAAAGVLWGLVEEADDLAATPDGGCRLSIQRLDLRLALLQVCEGLEPQAMAAGVILACPPAAAGLGVAVDPAALRGLLRRLLKPALRHTPPGGAVRMTLARVEGRVTATVLDPGGSATDPLDRLNGSMAGSLGGSLGVETVRTLAQRMGGTLEARADADGTLYVLGLPAAGAPVVAVRAGAVVLHIEDDPANIALMRQVTQALGLTFYAATSGVEGLDLARALRPDAILLDIDLPDMDGHEVRTRLALDPKTCAVPVVAVTAAAGQDDIRKAQALGFEAYLTKPLDLTALAAVLAAVLGDDGPEAVPSAEAML